VRRIEVVKAQASQKLWFQSAEGRPAATPTVGTKDSAGTEITAAASTYVTIDPVTTTVASAAAVGAMSVVLTAVTNIRIGAEYRIKNSLQQTEDVIVRGIDSSGKIVYLDEELQHAYAAADTFFSCEFCYTLQTADVASLGELFIATATYSVTGEQTAPLIQPFDVVLHPLRNRNPLTTKMIKTLWPDLTGQEWPEQAGLDYAPQRQQAWDEVCDALYTVPDPQTGRKRPGMVVSAENFTAWAIAEFAILLHEAGVPVLRVAGLEGAAGLLRLDEKLARRKSAALSSISWYEAGGEEDEVLDEETEKAPLPTHFVA
jgi:hypothetical protein